MRFFSFVLALRVSAAVISGENEDDYFEYDYDDEDDYQNDQGEKETGNEGALAELFIPDVTDIQCGEKGANFPPSSHFNRTDNKLCVKMVTREFKDIKENSESLWRIVDVTSEKNCGECETEKSAGGSCEKEKFRNDRGTNWKKYLETKGECHCHFGPVYPDGCNDLNPDVNEGSSSQTSTAYPFQNDLPSEETTTLEPTTAEPTTESPVETKATKGTAATTPTHASATTTVVLYADPTSGCEYEVNVKACGRISKEKCEIRRTVTELKNNPAGKVCYLSGSVLREDCTTGCPPLDEEKECNYQWSAVSECERYLYVPGCRRKITLQDLTPNPDIGGLRCSSVGSERIQRCTCPSDQGNSQDNNNDTSAPPTPATTTVAPATTTVASATTTVAPVTTTVGIWEKHSIKIIFGTTAVVAVSVLAMWLIFKPDDRTTRKSSRRVKKQ